MSLARDDVLNELEENRRKRLESRMDAVEGVLEDRQEIYEDVKTELDEEIRQQRNQLQRLSSSPNDAKEARVRDRLEELYRERREEIRSFWRDSEEWVEKKMDLEEELAELEDYDEVLEDT